MATDNIVSGLRSGRNSPVLLGAGFLLAVSCLLWALVMPRYIIREGQRMQILRRQIGRRQASLSGLN
jgi:hypothetical protein